MTSSITLHESELSPPPPSRNERRTQKSFRQKLKDLALGWRFYLFHGLAPDVETHYPPRRKRLNR
jgi:hypothetical protein